MTAPAAKNNTKPIRSHIPAALFLYGMRDQTGSSVTRWLRLFRGNRLNLFRGNSMNVAATVAPEELHICSRIASSNGRLKFQFVATIRTTVRIVIGRLHRARKTRGGSAWSCELTPSFCDRRQWPQRSTVAAIQRRASKRWPILERSGYAANAKMVRG